MIYYFVLFLFSCIGVLVIFLSRAYIFTLLLHVHVLTFFCSVCCLKIIRILACKLHYTYLVYTILVTLHGQSCRLSPYTPIQYYPHHHLGQTTSSLDLSDTCKAYNETTLHMQIIGNLHHNLIMQRLYVKRLKLTSLNKTAYGNLLSL